MKELFLEHYKLIRTIHIIVVISWFAGLFYTVRLFIYATEAKGSPNESILASQFEIMTRRLWLGSTWPAMIVTWGAGLWLAILYQGWTMPWLHLKLSF